MSHLKRALLVLAAVPAVAWAAEVFTAFDKDPNGSGIPASFQAWHSGFETNGDYGESWFFYDYTADGGVLMGMASVTNLGLRTFDGSVDVDFYAPDGSTHKIHKEYKREQVTGSTSSMDMTVGNARVWGGGSAYHFTVNEPDCKLKLDLANELPSWKMGDGKVSFYADKSAEWTLGLNAPRARASGSLTMDGQTWNLSGTAYHDHGWSTLKIPTFARKWFTLRVFDPAYTLILHHIYLTDKFGKDNIRMGLLGADNRIAGSTRNFLFQPAAWRSHESGRQVPTTLNVTVNTNGYSITGTLTESRFLEGVDVLGRLSWPIKTAIKTFYTNVWFFRFLAQYELDVTKDGQTTHISGQALVESNYY